MEIESLFPDENIITLPYEPQIVHIRAIVWMNLFMENTMLENLNNVFSREKNI